MPMDVSTNLLPKLITTWREAAALKRLQGDESAANLAEQGADAMEEVVELRTEIERLRRALRRIPSYCPVCDDYEIKSEAVAALTPDDEFARETLSRPVPFCDAIGPRGERCALEAGHAAKHRPSDPRGKRW